MTTYDITIIAKNKQILIYFFLFLKKITAPQFYYFTNYTKKEIKIKKITVLKSPHVNKKAQKKFEHRIFSKKISISVFNDMKFLIFLKKLKTKLFPEIKLKIEVTCDKKIVSEIDLLNPSCFSINSLNEKSIRIIKPFAKKNYEIETVIPCNKVQNYLKVFDCYGELNLLFYV